MKASMGWYALAMVLVTTYVNTFAIWRLLQWRFGEGAALVPWLLTAVLVFATMVSWGCQRRSRDASALILVMAVVVAIAGMLLCDPDFPAKRIHVPQYAILAAVIWCALRRNVDSDRVAVSTIFIAGLFGVHDEFLQGLHPDRMFGARDMAVNFLGSISGALALAGFTGPI